MKILFVMSKVLPPKKKWIFLVISNQEKEKKTGYKEPYTRWYN
jgi:hypothetical protein